MSAGRPPMQPPALPGYTPVRLLGSGGYSDVFLYEQEMPRRQVAIKVLVTADLGDANRRQFYDEANAMASVSTHPFIVTVFEAQVSSGGHPYLVMEFYPRQNFSVRARNEKIPVADVLRTSIQVASAVETAHRAGILHRDIKPANILTSEYNRPGLTDFGIATSASEGAEAEGMSIPWSPPEILDASAAGNTTADVYSLAATTYTLLAGRSPFEVPGGSNRQLDLMQRIARGDTPPTGRDDVPAALERALRHGMSRSPGDRPASAQQFARMLQSVEIELGLPPTQLEVSEDLRDVRARNDEPNDDGTRLKSPVIIRSQEPTGQGAGTIVTGAPDEATSVGLVGNAGAADGTVHRGSTVHRSTAAPTSDLISGVGSRPVGLSGTASPRPVSPMPSTAGATPITSGVDASGIPTESGQVARASIDSAVVGPSVLIRVAWVVLGIVAALLVTKLVIGAGTGGEVPEATPSTSENTLPGAGTAGSRAPTPTSVSFDGVVVTWQHPDQDPRKFTYVVLAIGGGRLAVADGVTTVALPEPATTSCVRVVASPKSGGKSSDELAEENIGCR